MNNQNTDCACLSDWTETNGAETEARFQRAKQALLDIQQQHCAAAEEFLLARTQMRRLLEAAFPGAEGVTRSPVSMLRLEICGDSHVY